ncbi:Fpg/Nei family DNA glycosylase [Kineococcus rhizosphaerae]|uniref:DNA-(apurinic or apyrimidinic site) lyase n=1 Tax=Kineococcus rhizosphaerae TaxID=559628 RepID=A0A2T0R7X4_9ACTN|nr:DNA glycosylase [Kineococcus rhizosphaerae]PRY17273.1 endonuclease-8 [Kineococcus rhizosphaerae]
MPEGHVLHRHARDQREALAGQVLSVTSPQGKFDVAPFDGHRLSDVQAHGKHLLYSFDGAPDVHVHLGMKGFFLRTDDVALPPLRATRMRLAGQREAFSLVAPGRCEALEQGRVQALLDTLGPDPLRVGEAGRDEAAHRLSSGKAAVGAALLDQSVWAGIGNAWRAELLFLAGVDPARRATPEEAGLLWDLAVEHLRLGVEAGQVVSDVAAPDERWVYERETCRRCGTPVRSWTLTGRTAYACPVDQR